MRVRFDGWIAGVGTASGTRFVLGCWPTSPFGPVNDVMVERPDGHRILLAGTEELGRFVAGTYSFDEVRVTPVRVVRDGPQWSVGAESFEARFTVGARTSLGLLLRAVPPALARRTAWVRLLDPLARLRRTRTYGTAGNGRREWYGAQDLHRIVAVRATVDGADLGPLADVDPPVRFGFGSTPRAASLTIVTSTVEVT